MTEKIEITYELIHELNVFYGDVIGVADRWAKLFGKPTFNACPPAEQQKIFAAMILAMRGAKQPLTFEPVMEEPKIFKMKDFMPFYGPPISKHLIVDEAWKDDLKDLKREIEAKLNDGNPEGN